MDPLSRTRSIGLRLSSPSPEVSSDGVAVPALYLLPAKGMTAGPPAKNTVSHATVPASEGPGEVRPHEHVTVDPSDLRFLAPSRCIGPDLRYNAPQVNSGR